MGLVTNFGGSRTLTVELQDLSWAVIAAQHQSLRRAAERLGVRQPTLSCRLRDLEYGLGAVLFEKTDGGTRPTAAGKGTLKTARHIIEVNNAAFIRHKARCRGENGRFVLCVYTLAITSSGHLHLKDTLEPAKAAELSQLHPESQVLRARLQTSLE